jgi:hypothetical protein
VTGLFKTDFSHSIPKIHGREFLGCELHLVKNNPSQRRCIRGRLLCWAMTLTLQTVFAASVATVLYRSGLYKELFNENPAKNLHL